MRHTPLNRRRFLQVGGSLLAGALLAACTRAPGTPRAGGGPQPPADPTPTSPVARPSAAAAPASPASPASRAAAARQASPPVAANSASPAPLAPLAPAMIGRLVVVAEPYPRYEGAPTDSPDRLTIVRGGDDLADLTPTALASYSPFTFCYDPLVWIDEQTLEPKPWLAEKWEVSPDGRAYTFTLRRDVRWHDGTPLTAADVAFSMVAYRDDQESAVARLFAPLQRDPVVLDPVTLLCQLADPSGDWLLNACNQFVLQERQFRAHWDAARTLRGFDYAGRMLVGTGAWRPVRYAPAGSPPAIEYEANRDYFPGGPHFSRLAFRQIEQPAVRLAAWRAGEADLLWPVTAAEVEGVREQDGYLYSAYAAAFMCAWFNFQNPASATPAFLRDRRVRQALSVGIDRRRYARAVFRGFVDETRVGSVALPWAHHTGLRNPDYDPQRAAQLLAASGYTKSPAGALRDPAGQPVKLVAIVLTNPGYPVDQVAASVQEDFEQLGIDLELQPLDSAALRTRWADTHDYDLYFASRILYAGFADQRYYGSEWDVRASPQGRNFGGWRNDEADRLLAQIGREPDLARQRDLLWRFQEVIADDLPAIWLGFPRDLILVRPHLRGYQPNAMWQYWDTWKLWSVSPNSGVPLRFTSDDVVSQVAD